MEAIGKGLGKVFMAVLGMKSKRGESKGAMPYCMASSRPRSRGILGGTP